jgi:hypothetical protein
MQDDRRLSPLDPFLADFEAEYGQIGPEEIAEATHRARARAIVVRAQKAA